MNNDNKLKTAAILAAIPQVWQPPVHPARRPDDETATQLAKLTSHGEVTKAEDGSDDDDFTPPPSGGGVSAALPRGTELASTDSISELLNRFEAELQKLASVGEASKQVIEAARHISRTGLIIQTVRLPLESIVRDVSGMAKSNALLVDEVAQLRRNLTPPFVIAPPTFKQRIASLIWHVCRVAIVKCVIGALAIYGAINLAAPYFPMAIEFIQQFVSK
jgi:hypothetical protein